MTNPREARRRRLRGRFLLALAEHGIVARAARAAKASRRLFYHWRDHDPEFAARWDQALALGLAALEDAAMTRALDGAERVVRYRGKPVGTERRPSDALLMFLLRNRLPERYGWGSGGKAAIWARAEASRRGGGGNMVSPEEEKLTPEQRERRIKALLTKAGLGLVELPDASMHPMDVSYRESLMGPSPSILDPGPGRDENGP